MLEGNDFKVIRGDCLEEMKKFKLGGVDMVFTSPPYNDTGKGISESSKDMNKNYKDTHSKYEVCEFREDWFEWQCECIDEMIRVAKNYVFYNVQAIMANKNDVYRLIGKYAEQIYTILIWHKLSAQPTGTPHSISNCYEFIIVFKGSKFTKLKTNASFYWNVIEKHSNTDQRYSDIHHALMPQKLADEIIFQFTKEGETVLDPFCGLATTGIACLNFGRKFIGIEISEKYAKIAEERLIAEKSQYRLEL